MDTLIMLCFALVVLGVLLGVWALYFNRKRIEADSEFKQLILPLLSEKPNLEFYPPPIQNALTSIDGAIGIILALVLDHRYQEQKDQWNFLSHRKESHWYQSALSARGHVQHLNKKYFIQVLELACEVIRLQPNEIIDPFMEIIEELISQDSFISLHEYCVYKYLTSRIPRASQLHTQKKDPTLSEKAARELVLESMRSENFSYVKIENAVRVLQSSSSEFKEKLIVDLLYQAAEDNALSAYELELYFAVSVSLGISRERILARL
jgi:hypothetical protein